MYFGRRLLNAIILTVSLTYAWFQTTLFNSIHIDYLVRNIFIRLPSYDSTAKMRCCCRTCEDHKNKPRDQRRSHFAYRREHSSCNWLTQGVGWSFDLQFLFGRATSIGFQESSCLINFHSYQSIKGFYFISLFSSNQSHQKAIITSIINVRLVNELDWHQSCAILTQVRVCVSTVKVHVCDHVHWIGKTNRKSDMFITLAVISWENWFFSAS